MLHHEAFTALLLPGVTTCFILPCNRLTSSLRGCPHYANESDMDACAIDRSSMLRNQEEAGKQMKMASTQKYSVSAARLKLVVFDGAIG